MGLEKSIEKAALLHDIGKVVLRAEPGTGNHSAVGGRFLSKFTPLGSKIVKAAEYHHKAALEKAKCLKDDIRYIVYEADNIAAGTDRRENEGDAGGGFTAAANLESVFNVFDEPVPDVEKGVFSLKGLLEKENLQYPVKKRTIKAASYLYKALLQHIEVNFRKRSPEEMEPNELLQLLEGVLSYVPSSTNNKEAADISLYDHVKMTAAFAVCMYQYFAANNITDYKKYCYLQPSYEMRKNKVYLLVSGDISGIQDFIYTIPSKGALKSLRGRSFYLEILLEHIADEILTASHLSRSALLYTGGGHFYLLLANTSENIDLLNNVAVRINEWLLHYFGSRLYLALGWAACSANDFMESEAGKTGKVYRKVSEILSRNKLQRYTQEQLGQLFSPESYFNMVKYGERECSICHSSTGELEAYSEDNPDTLACPYCRRLFQLGSDMLNKDIIAVYDEPHEKSFPLPTLTGECYMVVVSEKEVTDAAKRRLYVKNRMLTGESMATVLWMGDYSKRNEHRRVMEFEELAEISGGCRESSGIKRLAVMRADVDNLGSAFIAGFNKKYATLSRSAVLSRQLSMFFKRYINDICLGNSMYFSEAEKQFRLFEGDKASARALHIVYSGGDDVFVVGAWDDVLEMSVDLYRAFKCFNGGKLTFSAGIGFFKDKTPISFMAEETGKLESFAKKNPDKNSISLFGFDSEIYNENSNKEAQVYQWSDFIEGVCGEKLSFIKEHFSLRESDGNKLYLGKSLIYKLLELLENCSEGINLARFAYIIARMKPDSKNSVQLEHYKLLRGKLYEWYKADTDRQELITALQLLVYSLRDKEEK